MTRAIFAVLAVADALLFFYLFANYGWFNVHQFTEVSQDIVGIVVLPLLWGITLLDRIVTAAFFVAVGSGIWKDLAGRERPRWAAVVTTPVLIFSLAAIAFLWIVIVRDVVSQPAGMVYDRLTLFDELAREWRIADIEMFGVVNYAIGGSIGRSLVILLGVLYLAEKYLLQSWRVRWPVPLTPLLAVGWLAAIVAVGESRQREYVAAQQWRAIGPAVTWLDAMRACEAIGDGWRLPRPQELIRFVASGPAEIQSWQGAAWTNQIENNGEWAVAVDLAPRKSGRWNKASEPTRDESLCELRSQPGYATDWFASFRDEVCDRTSRSPYLFTPGLHPTVRQAGASVTQQPGAAVCIRPAGESTFPNYQQRGWDAREEPTAAAFLDAIIERCRTLPNPHRRLGCVAYAPR
jgi:hypothetical protein